MAKIADMALDGRDPRLPGDLFSPSGPAYVRPQARALHDKNVTFEEYHYYALQTRAEEEEAHRTRPGSTGILSLLLPSKSSRGAGIDDPSAPSAVAGGAAVSDEEWANASRAVRTASIGAVFYLITTDILGPFNLPYAFALTGWGPGVALYTVFGFLAGVSGWLLWQCFMGLDSHQYPVRSYGDLGFRLLGAPARHAFNVLQALQLVCSVGLIVLSNGEALSEISRFRLCYAVCCLVWALAGFALGQIRTLQRLGWLANAGVWLHLLIVGATMGVAAAVRRPRERRRQRLRRRERRPGRRRRVPARRALRRPARAAPDQGVAGRPRRRRVRVRRRVRLRRVHGRDAPPARLPQGHVGRAGAHLRRLHALRHGPLRLPGPVRAVAVVPRHRGPRLADGRQRARHRGVAHRRHAVRQHRPERYTASPCFPAVPADAMRAVVYNNVLVAVCRAPPLTHPRGKAAWAALVPLYWGAAYALAAAVPAFGSVQAVVSAAAILPFTYVFPPLLNVAFHVRRGAAGARDAGALRRLARGFCAGGRAQVALNAWNVVYCAGALATTALGLYAGVEALVDAYGTPEVNAFSCRSPLDDS